MVNDVKELAEHCNMGLEEFLQEEKELQNEIPADIISLIPGNNICYNPFKIISSLPYILVIRPIMDIFEYP
jgi:hypothetical protein